MKIGFQWQGFHIVFLLQLCIIFSLMGAPTEGYSKNLKKMMIIESQKGEPYASITKAILKHLASRGFEQGKTLEITHWSIGNSQGMAKRIWSIEKDNRYDAVYLGGTMATKYFRNFAYQNPHFKFVFGGVTDPVGLGVIDNFHSPPKANFTGVCYPVQVVDRLRFLKSVQPVLKNIGYIYAEMPQSESYTRWLKEVLSSDEFQDLKFHFRKVQFVPGEGGHIRMADLAKKYVRELNPIVDVFLSPNDQMGARQPFVRTVAKNGTKPLIGLGEKDVQENWGATLSYFPSSDSAGRQAAEMLVAIFEGHDFKTLVPQWPEAHFAVNDALMSRYGLKVTPKGSEPLTYENDR